MDYSKVKFRYNENGALEGVLDGKVIGEIYTQGDQVVEGERTNGREDSYDEDGWVTMSGLHVLIDDATGKIMSGPLKGQQHTPVLQTKKQKSDLKKQAAKASQAIGKANAAMTNAHKNSSKTNTKKGSAARKQLTNAFSKMPGGTTMSVLGMTFTRQPGQYAWKDQNGNTYTDGVMAYKLSGISNAAKATKIQMPSTNTQAVAKKMASVPTGTQIYTGASNYVKQPNGTWSSPYKSGMSDDEVAGYCANAGTANCKVTLPKKTAPAQQSTTGSSGSTQGSSQPSLTQTLQANAKSMNLSAFKNSMQSGMDAAAAGTTMDWGGKSYTKMQSGNWQYQDANGKYHVTSAKQVAHLATLKGANNQAPTPKTQKPKTQAPAQPPTPTLTQTLQSNAKTMKLAAFKQSMQQGMDAATTGTTVDWGGKQYVKQSDGSWQYKSADGKTHQTTAKQVAHLATLKGGSTPASAQASTQATTTTGTSQKGYDSSGNIVDHVGVSNSTQKVLGKVTPNANLKKVTNAAGDHQVADGKDISKTVKISTTSKWNSYEQIAMQQGYKNPPQVVTDKATFDKIVQQSGIIMFRSDNTSGNLTGKQMVENLKNYDPNKQQANWGGGQAHGYGIYYATNITTGGNKAGVTRASASYAKRESLQYSNQAKGSVQHKATLQPGSKIITEQQAYNDYNKLSASEQKKYQHSQYYSHTYDGPTAYAAARGYDAVQKAYTTEAYTMVLNPSKIVIFDSNEVEY